MISVSDVIQWKNLILFLLFNKNFHSLKGNNNERKVLPVILIEWLLCKNHIFESKWSSFVIWHNFDGMRF